MSKPANGRSSFNPDALRRALLSWYARHKRDLPWRRDRDPYRVWVSEIMLQQTRVAAVLEHYLAFLRAFPTLERLGAASEEQVLARWSGLGYYRRARMLHRAAGKVVREAGGVIPGTQDELRKLPGVGRYTAAAIASIAFGEPVAVLDGNVERVLSRLDRKPRSHPSKPKAGSPRTPSSAAAAWKRAQDLLDRHHPGEWNQAMMELGATVCTPCNPQCPVCPVQRWCCARSRAPGTEAVRPRPARRKVQSMRNLIARGERIFLVQRPPNAAKMAGMWELPELIPLLPKDGRSGARSSPAAGRALPGELCVLRHSITDTDYEVRVLRLGLRALSAKQKRAGRWVCREKVFDLPLTGLTRKILRRVPLLQELSSVLQSGKPALN